MRLVILDVNGTLFPLDPVQDRLHEVGLAGVLELWFARILRDGFAHAAAGTLARFPELAGHHLTVLLEEGGVTATDERLTHVLEGFDHTRAHADVEPALRRLTEHGVTVVTMTNGTVAITEAFLERNGLDRYVHATHDVSEAGVWKPARAAYQYVLDRHRVTAQDAALVAMHPWDVHGAATAGLATGWVDRDGGRYPSGMTPPDVRGSSMLEVVEGLLAAPG